MNSRRSFALALCLGVFVFSHANADHHKKKSKVGDELTQCTIVNSKSDMRCVSPTKLVCQKLNSGKKCCDCVGDKNAPAPNLVQEFCCTAMYGTKATSSMCDKDRAEAERQAGLVRLNGQPPSSISCVVEKHFQH